MRLRRRAGWWSCVGLAACIPAIACAQTGASRVYDPTAPGAPPQLTAIIVSGTVRTAIFLAPDNLGSLVVGEGGQIGAFEVAAILPDRAELTSPSGSYTIEPTPHAGRRSLLAAMAPAMPLVSPAYREAVTESDQ